MAQEVDSVLLLVIVYDDALLCLQHSFGLPSGLQFGYGLVIVVGVWIVYPLMPENLLSRFHVDVVRTSVQLGAAESNSSEQFRCTWL